MDRFYVDLEQITQFSALRIVDYYDDVGYFEIYCPVSEKNRLLLDYFHIINFNDPDDNSKNAGIIKRVSKVRLDDGTTQIYAMGTLMGGLLHDRMVWGQQIYSGFDPTVTAMRLFEFNFVHPTEVRPPLEPIIVGTYPAITLPAIEYQKTGGEAYTAITEILQTYGYGYEVILDYNDIDTTYFLRFNVLQGANRSVAQTVLNDVTFSLENGSISSSEYTDDCENIKSVAQVAGAGEGAERWYQTVIAQDLVDTYGWRELFVDARDLQQKDASGNTIPNGQYSDMLVQRGREKLAEYVRRQTFEISIVYTGRWILGTDFFKGDIVSIDDSELGVKANARITGIEKSYDENGAKTVNLILGIPKITVSQAVQAKFEQK